MAIQELLGETTAATFVENYYHKLPFAYAGGCPAASTLADWTLLERLLVAPGVDLMVVRAGERYAGELPRDLAAARALYAQGYTFVVRHAERNDRGLAALAEDFARDFASPVDVHLYYTPGGNHGFSWHYDAEDVFILQAEGAKQYSLRKNTVQPWPVEETLPEDMGYRHEIMPLMQCTLRAGDWLYIPAGYWHRAQSEGDSCSLAVGLMSATALDLIDLLRTRLLGSLSWRRRLPVCGAATAQSDESLAAQYQEIATELARDLEKQLTDPALIAEFLAARRPLASASAASRPASGPLPIAAK